MKKRKKKQEKIKKEEFKSVSKNVINTSRPEIGNMFSKSLKKLLIIIKVYNFDYYI